MEKANFCIETKELYEIAQHVTDIVKQVEYVLPLQTLDLYSSNVIVSVIT